LDKYEISNCYFNIIINILIGKEKFCQIYDYLMNNVKNYYKFESLINQSIINDENGSFFEKMDLIIYY